MGDRKVEILDAACRVVARTGVRSLRVEEIAREAGVSVALLYYYFKGRDELLRQVLEHAYERAEAFVRPDFDVRADAIERVELSLLAEIQDDPAVIENAAVWGEVVASAVFEPALRDAVRTISERWIEWVADFIRQGQGERAIPPTVDALAAAARLTALTDGLSVRWLTGSLSTDEARHLLRGAVAAELGLTSPGAGLLADRSRQGETDP